MKPDLRALQELPTCIHQDAATHLFNVPYLGDVRVCQPCRRELALRTVERPRGLVPVDHGRLGYKCRMCGGEYTSTDAMTCKCEGRKEDCEHNRKAIRELLAYEELVR